MQITEIITEIITDETLREIREHGTPEFLLNIIWMISMKLVRVMLNGTGIMRVEWAWLNLEK